MSKDVIAILTADWHFSEKPPIYRSAEPDWYAAMERPFNEVQDLAKKYVCPILVAGDIFDKWNVSSELLNWFHRGVRKNVHIFATPGQHDLPHHSLQEFSKSALCTLDHMKSVATYLANDIAHLYALKIWWFPFGVPLGTPTSLDPDVINLAIIHKYVWIKECKYPQASKKDELNYRHLRKHCQNGKLYGFDVIAYGDNHIGFTTKVANTTIFNCGTLMRRRTDETRPPQVGLLRRDGSVKTHCLDTKKDKYLRKEKARDLEKLSEQELDMTELAEELAKLGVSAFDFTDAVERFCKKHSISKSISSIIREAMEYGKSSG